MSIVVAVIDSSGNDVYLASDRKGADMEGNFLKREFIKTHPINPNLYFTGNGVFEICIQVKDHLLTLTNVAEMIEYLDLVQIKTTVVNGKELGDCTFVLAGRYDDNEPFIYVRITKDAKGHFLRAKQGRIIYALAVEDPEVCQELHSFIPNEINRIGYELGIKNTMILASKLSESIGETHDIIRLRSQISSYGVN